MSCGLENRLEEIIQKKKKKTHKKAKIGKCVIQGIEGKRLTYLIIIILKILLERQTEGRQGEAVRHIFHLLVHLPNAF